MDHCRGAERSAAEPGTGSFGANVALPALIAAEFLGTTLWFSASAVAPQIARALDTSGHDALDLSSPVQFGFVAGTLILGFTGLGDAFRASRIFLVASVLGAVANALICAGADSIRLVLLLRALTGIALAGIYPIGMKLAIGWSAASARTILGWLVGMLTLGTAFPHLVNYASLGVDWQLVVLTSSVLACLGGLVVILVGDGPSLPSSRRDHRPGLSVWRDFRRPPLRLAAIAYLGHMWELYAFWALVPTLVSYAIGDRGGSSMALCAFSIIAVGSIGCIFGGYVSARIGSREVACLSMAISAAMCLGFPLVADAAVLLVLLHVWGFFVIADSPQLSTLASEAASSDRIGSTLALLNGVGFLLTAISIHLVTSLWSVIGALTTWVLFPGPCAGALVLLAARRRSFALTRGGTAKRVSA